MVYNKVHKTIEAHRPLILAGPDLVPARRRGQAANFIEAVHL